MKKFLLITSLFILQTVCTHAQQNNTQSSLFLDGKYALSIQNNNSNQGNSICIHNNLPGIYHIQAMVEIIDAFGQKKMIQVNKQKVGSEFVLYQDKNLIQSLTIKSISIDYTQYGEAYQLTWQQNGNGLNFGKQGKEYSYANPFTLKANAFQWSASEHKYVSIDTPNENIMDFAND